MLKSFQKKSKGYVMLDMNAEDYQAYLQADDKYRLLNELGQFAGVAGDAPPNVRESWIRLKRDIDALDE